jgi:hypothetical protein
MDIIETFLSFDAHNTLWIIFASPLNIAYFFV